MFYVFAKFQIGNDNGLMDSWKTLIVFFFQKPKFVSFLLFNSAVVIHNHRIRSRRIRRPWRTFVLLPRTKPSGHWEVAIWFRLGCSTKLFLFKNIERVKMNSIIKKTYHFFIKFIKKSLVLLKNSEKCNLQNWPLDVK